MPKVTIDDRYRDTPYYLAPEDKVGQEAFAVIRDAMRNKKKMVGIGRVVMARRERVMMLEPFDKGIMGATLLEARPTSRQRRQPHGCLLSERRRRDRQGQARQGRPRLRNPKPRPSQAQGRQRIGLDAFGLLRPHIHSCLQAIERLLNMIDALLKSLQRVIRWRILAAV